MDNLGDTGDLVVTGVHRSLRWQPDPYLDSDCSDHLDIQPGRWPARLGPGRALAEKTHERKPSRSGEGRLHFAHAEREGP